MATCVTLAASLNLPGPSINLYLVREAPTGAEGNALRRKENMERPRKRNGNEACKMKQCKDSQPTPDPKGLMKSRACAKSDLSFCPSMHLEEGENGLPKIAL